MMLLLFLLLSIAYSATNGWTADTEEADQRSQQLFDVINDDRVARGKDPLVWSNALTYVAQLRADDAEKVDSSFSTYFDGSCCPYYSWTNEGPWEGICYPISGASYDEWLVCTGKAKELTQFPGDITYVSQIKWYSDTFDSAEECFEALNTSSRGDRVLNKGFYEDYDWLAAGCAWTDHRVECFLSNYDTDDTQREFTCDGVDATDTEVCNGGAGVGSCVGPDDCQCFKDQECTPSDDTAYGLSFSNLFL